MAKRKADSDAVANPDGTPKQVQPEAELPFVESPSTSPAKPETNTKPLLAEASAEPPAADAPENESAPATPEILAPAQPTRPWFALRPRYRRRALLAASVAIAAAFGAVVGAAATGGLSKPAVDVAAEENKATQQSLVRLAKEVASLKTSLDAANKSAHSQIAKISERLSETGSIAPPQTVPAAPQPTAPLPAPRPTIAAAEPPPSPRRSIVSDWSIRETRDGYVYVQGHGSDIYQVVPGAPLPGLGPVEQIKRQDGRWMVVTPKGIIVSMRDRRYFEHF
jgi:hypothetical protein